MTAAKGLGDLTLLTHAFSTAAIDPTLWKAAMDAAAQATGSVGALMLPLRGHIPNVPISESIAESISVYFRDGWHLRDERYRGVPTMLRRGSMSDLDFAEPDEFARSPYYHELLAPFGLRWFVGIKVAAGDDIWCLAIQRSIKQGPFPTTDLRKLGALSQNLSSAAALARALGFAQVEGACEGFEISGSAVVLFDRHGQVLRVNKAAEQVLRPPHLRIVNKRLVCWQREATDALDRAIHALLWRRDGSSLMPPVVLPRVQGRPILAYPSRLTGAGLDFFVPCQALIVLIDLERRPQGPKAEVLARAFDLSPAEARLAALIAAGRSPQQAAHELGLAHETVRNQLKAVFAKTGTHRQADLVALSSRL